MRKILIFLSVIFALLFLASCDVSQQVKDGEDMAVEGGAEILGGYMRKSDKRK